jgi:hypothetical protein
MDTQLQYYGRLRLAEHCGTLDDGRDVYLIDGGQRIRAVVRKSTGTSEQAMALFLGGSNTVTQLREIAKITWSDSDAATRAKAWVKAQCRAMAIELREAMGTWPELGIDFEAMAEACESKAAEVSL